MSRSMGGRLVGKQRMPSLSHRYPTGSQIDGAAVGVAILVRTAGSAPLTGSLAEASL